MFKKDNLKLLYVTDWVLGLLEFSANSQRALKGSNTAAPCRVQHWKTVINISMKVGSLPKTCLNFIPGDMHLLNGAYLQNKMHLMLACWAGDVDI